MVLLIAVLHFIPDAEDPYGIMKQLMDGVPPGSYLVISHAASDIAAGATAEMARRYNELSPVSITPRSREQVARCFDGLDKVPPGLVRLSQWWESGPAQAGTASDLAGYCGIGRKRDQSCPAVLAPPPPQWSGGGHPIPGLPTSEKRLLQRRP